MTAITCLDVGGSFIRYGRYRAGQVMEIAGKVKTPGQDYEAFVLAMGEAAKATGADVLSLSIAGAYDRATGLARVANIPCLNGTRLAVELRQRLGVEVIVHNDADCFALAEAHGGAGAGHGVVFAIILGTGVGGGVVVNGHILDGHGGISGEWGHGPVVDPAACGASIPPEYLRCGCGQTGCLDAIGSARGLEKLHMALHGIELASVDITSGWHGGDAWTARTVEVFVCHIARPLRAMVNLLGPGAVPVGGGLAGDKELIAHIDRAVRDRALAEFEKPLVVPGVYLTDGGLIGAGIAAEQVLAERAL